MTLRRVRDENTEAAVGIALRVHDAARDLLPAEVMADGVVDGFIAALAAQTPAAKPVSIEQLACILHDDARHPLMGACDECRRKAARMFEAIG